MKEAISAGMAGGMFGAGLSISGMLDPQNVLAFLTISSTWNPALILVMGSAVVTTTIGYRLVRMRRSPLWARQFSFPTTVGLDARLVSGAAIFGVGWGLSGYCPGPAIVGGFMFDFRALAFLVAFLVGLFAYEAFEPRKEPANTLAISDG